MCRSNNGSILSPIVISTLPKTVHARVLPNDPLSLIAACPATNYSPSERSAVLAIHRMAFGKTLATILGPLSRSAAYSRDKYIHCAPKMMMRIDDWNIRLQYLFDGFPEPVVVSIAR